MHIIGSAQITAAGTASIKLRPAPGNYTYKAQFVGTAGFASSMSQASSLAVTGNYPSTTLLTDSGSVGNFSLTATVSGAGKISNGPTGTVSFLDTTANNAVLASVSLSDATTEILGNVSNPATLSEPDGVVAGDFNGDGNIDLAVGNGGPSLGVLLGDGTGNFTQTTNGAITTIGQPVAVADFNADGRPDILVANGSGQLEVLLGNGDGTFTTAPNSPIATNYGSQPAVVADFNGDGIPDFAAGGAYYLTVFLGKGDGSFTEVPITSSTPIADGFESMVAGDFNGDGMMDLAATNGGTITVFLGNGDGTFQAGTSVPAATGTGGLLALGDFNGDGKLDLAVSVYGSSSQLIVLLGNGDGTFSPAPGSPISAGSWASGVYVGDFNGDGVPDLLVSAQTNLTDVFVFLGKGDGTFTEASTGNLALPCCWNSVLADFNGDGMTDDASSSFYDNTVQVLLGNIVQATATATGVNAIGPGTDQVVAKYPGDTNFVSSTSASLALQSAVATPVLSPPPGIYTSAQTITITDSSPGATVYYSLLSSPTWTSVAYSGPITVSAAGPQTLSVYATAPGSFPSPTVTAGYTLLLPQTPAPTISLASGSYSGSQSVTLSDALAGAQIYYTTDGSTPTTYANLYTGAISISSTETLAALAVATGDSPSPVASAQYTITSASSVPLIYSVAGTGTIGYTGDGGGATLAELDGPSSAVKDAAGNIYIADTYNHAVRKVAAGTGIISTIAGNGVTGNSGDNGPATSAALSYPVSLALDGAGNLFIGDQIGVVRMVNLGAGTISTFAGNPSATLTTGSPATSVNLGVINGIALDASGNVYVSTQDTILEITNSNSTVSVLAGGGSYQSNLGDGGPASMAYLLMPEGLAFDTSGNLYIADSEDQVVRKIAATNGVVSPSSIITTVAGTINLAIPSENSGPATTKELISPDGIAVDKSNNLYISDYDEDLVWVVNASTGIMSKVAGHLFQCQDLSGDGGSATNEGICSPYGISVDQSGNILITFSTGNRVREIVTPSAPPTAQAATPTISLQSGSYSTAQSATVSDSTPGASIYVTVDGSSPATFSNGYSFPITVAGAVTLKAVAVAPGYVASAPASASYTVTASEPVISTIAGNGIHGQFLMMGSLAALGAGGAATQAEFGRPFALATDKSGDIYFSDTDNHVVWRIATADGNISVVAGTGQAGRLTSGALAINAPLHLPRGLALDSAGNLYIADQANYAVRKVDAKTGIISTVAGNGLGYSTGGSGDGGPATAAELVPAGIAFDAANDLFILDEQHSTIRKVSAQTGVITTVAGNGQWGYSGDGGPATQAELEASSGIAVTPSGDIYFISGNLVRKVSAATGVISTVAGTYDIEGERGDGGAATSAQINPSGLTLDSAGNLYISNWPGSIREVNASTGTISRVAGVGFAGYSGDGGPALTAQLNGPFGLAFDPSGNLIVTDSANWRIRKITFAVQTAATPVISLAAGTYSAAQSVTITDATPASTIYYTTDGSMPSAASTVYSGPITVNSSETISAIATAANFNNSAVAKAAYVIGIPAPAPILAGLSPAVAVAGGSGFTLTVNGSSFTSASSVFWGANALVTTFVSSTQLTAQVPAASIALAGVSSVSVKTPAPGGGASNTLEFEVDTAGSATPPSFNPPSATVSAGSTATYSVTLPSGATNVSVTCLNLPVNASCAYSASSEQLTIATAASTPSGTYLITVVFTETPPGAATALILLPGLLTLFAEKKRRKQARLIALALVVFAVAMVAAGGGCGGGGGSSNTTPPPTHQVTSSSTVTLVVK